MVSTFEEVTKARLVPITGESAVVGEVAGAYAPIVYKFNSHMMTFGGMPF